MPLSEQEQRLLDEMERNLYQNDADFVSTGGSRASRPSYRAIALGSLIALAGIITLLVGVGTRLPVIGVIGFVVMFAGVLLAVTPARSTRASSAKGRSRRGPAKKPAAAGSFMNQLNDRWDRRQDNRE
jgi:Flp pilus assembly protein TadB